MARSVKGLALVNFVENIAMKRIFSTNRGVRSLHGYDTLTDKNLSKGSQIQRSCCTTSPARLSPRPSAAAVGHRSSYHEELRRSHSHPVLPNTSPCPPPQSSSLSSPMLVVPTNHSSRSLHNHSTSRRCLSTSSVFHPSPVLPSATATDSTVAAASGGVTSNASSALQDTNTFSSSLMIRRNATYTGGGVGSVAATQTDLGPQALAEPDLLNMFIEIRKALKSSERGLEEIACYYFDGQGKAIRPIITVLMARALNQHVGKHHRLLASQLEIAKVTEMIHTASLLHDDVLDMADTRRGKASVTTRYGQKKSVMGGDYILSVASTMIARLHNPRVTIILAQVLADLVQGEFMQLGSKENENERFSHYLAKTYKKTASLIANSCQAVSVLGGADDTLQDVCFQYGRNIGIAFQLVDDFLDFVANSNIFGKPTTVDLKLGFATAPVLFACDKFPELNPLILRRFSEPGDVEFALDCVHRSDGLVQTQLLARKHCLEAIRVLDRLANSEEKMALVSITDKILNRIR